MEAVEKNVRSSLPFVFILASLAEVGKQLKGKIFDSEVDVFGGRRGAEFFECFIGGEIEKEVRKSCAFP